MHCGPGEQPMAMTTFRYEHSIEHIERKVNFEFSTALLQVWVVAITVTWQRCLKIR